MGTRSPSPLPSPPPSRSLSGSRFICTTTARFDTPALRLWPLLVDAAGWPRWWTAVARCDRPPTPGRPWPRRTGLGGLRVAMGWPLHLTVAPLASQPHEWLTLQLHGDLQGQATFMLQLPGPPERHPRLGLDLTCRCELQAPRHGLWPGSVALEHRMQRLMQTLVRDLGRRLNCHSQVLGHWQGSNWLG